MFFRYVLHVLYTDYRVTEKYSCLLENVAVLELPLCTAGRCAAHPPVTEIMKLITRNFAGIFFHDSVQHTLWKQQIYANVTHPINVGYAYDISVCILLVMLPPLICA